ncbi:MAG: hypothetical protein J7M08_00715 [Planctomycetes bacterium]|nr:hypothetical protein [Planctomycetota bacterium]
MNDEEFDTFEVSEPSVLEPEKPSIPETKGETVAERKYLCITIVDHNPIIDGTGEQSYVNIRVPVALAEAGLAMIPKGKLVGIEPEVIVEMIEEGANGELINIKEEKKSISIRIE